jgi:hypothetical protein
MPGAPTDERASVRRRQGSSFFRPARICFFPFLLTFARERRNQGTRSAHGERRRAHQPLLYGCQMGSKYPIVHVKKDQAYPIHFRTGPCSCRMLVQRGVLTLQMVRTSSCQPARQSVQPASSATPSHALASASPATPVVSSSALCAPAWAHRRDAGARLVAAAAVAVVAERAAAPAGGVWPAAAGFHAQSCAFGADSSSAAGFGWTAATETTAAAAAPGASSAAPPEKGSRPEAAAAALFAVEGTSAGGWAASWPCPRKRWT